MVSTVAFLVFLLKDIMLSNGWFSRGVVWSHKHGRGTLSRGKVNEYYARGGIEDLENNGRARRYGATRVNDPWKVLIRKIGTSAPPSKSNAAIVGKVSRIQAGVYDELQCPHFGTCSGCTIQGNFTETPLAKRAKNFFITEGVNMRLHIGSSQKWRTHAKLAVQPLSRWGGLKIGLYKAGSHEVEAISDCKVHHPRINEAANEVRKAASDVGVKGYQEGRNGLESEGDLRYLQLSVERSTSKVMIVLVWNAFDFKTAGQTLPRFVKALRNRPDIWHSIHVNFQTSASNTIFNYHPKAWKVLWGPPVLREKIGSLNFFFAPQVFRQANLDEFESGIIPLVVENIPTGSRVSELYSGLGVLGLNVAASDRAEEVYCSDNNDYVDEVFDKCADSLPEASKERVYFENLAADEAVAEGQCEDADVLIVDPPRKGLDEGVLQLLLNNHESAKASNLKRLVYVSCGFEALERDCRALLVSNLWKIKSADGFILFPGSDHIESVVVFDKKV